MFEDIQETVNRYIYLKEETRKVELFLKETLRTRLNNAKQEDILDTVIALLDNQKPLDMIKHEAHMDKVDALELVHART